MRRRTLWLMLALLGVMTFSGPAQAKDEVSFRMVAGTVPGLEELKLSGTPLGTLNVPLDDDTGGNVELSVVNRMGSDQPAGLLFSGGFFVRTHSGKDEFGDEFRLDVYGINVGPGLFVNLSEFWHLEFKAMGGFGVARQDLPWYWSDGDGPYYSYRASAGLYGKLANKVLLGAETGYMSYRSIGTSDTGTFVEDTDFSGSGPTASLVIGVVF